MTDSKKDVNGTQPRSEAPEKAAWEAPIMRIVPLTNTELFENFGIDFGSFS